MERSSQGQQALGAGCAGGLRGEFSPSRLPVGSADAHVPQVGESWYTDNTCSRLCTCSTHSNISCRQSTCKPGQVCRPLDGLLSCRTSGGRPWSATGGREVPDACSPQAPPPSLPPPTCSTGLPSLPSRRPFVGEVAGAGDADPCAIRKGSSGSLVVLSATSFDGTTTPTGCQASSSWRLDRSSALPLRQAWECVAPRTAPRT